MGLLIIQILKWILRIILFLLLLLLVLLFLVLVVPIRYQAEGAYQDKKPNLQGKVSWFFHLLHISFQYREEFLLKVKVLGMSVFDSSKSKEETDTGDMVQGENSDTGDAADNKNEENFEAGSTIAAKKDKSGTSSTIASKKDKPETSSTIASKKDKPETSSTIASKKDKSETSSTIAAKKDKSGTSSTIASKKDKSETSSTIAAKKDKKNGQPADNHSKAAEEINPKPASESEHNTQNRTDASENKSEHDTKQTVEKNRKADNVEKPSDIQKDEQPSDETMDEPVEEEKEKTSIIEKIKGIYAKIKEAIQKVKDVKALVKHYLELWNREETQITFKRCKTKLWKMTKSVLPRKWNLQGEVGFSDPCTTGQMMGGLGMFYPVIGNHILITPNFETEVMNVNGFVKGHIRLGTLLYQLVSLLLNKHCIAFIKLIFNEISNHKKKKRR